MKIGILVSTIKNFGEQGFYNSQEIGMAKALSALGHDITVYKALGKANLPTAHRDIGINVNYFFVKSIGINGLVDTSVLDNLLDALIYFSDIQLSVPHVFKWCKRNNVIFIPYIGVIHSHSENSFKRFIKELFAKRNIVVYKKNVCLAKNCEVKRELESQGINQVVFSPVGIDIDLLNSDYASIDTAIIKQRFGFDATNRIILFVGRLEEEKRPLDLIEIFKEVFNSDPNFRLIIVGKGYMLDKVKDRIDQLRLNEQVMYISKLPNEKIWELYRIAEVFVNLNKQEIFGMVLLEAMFYETKIIAHHAPGPDYIIEDGLSGILANNDREIINSIMNDKKEYGKAAHERVINYLTWERTAKEIESIVDKG